MFVLKVCSFGVFSPAFGPAAAPLLGFPPIWSVFTGCVLGAPLFGLPGGVCSEVVVRWWEVGTGGGQILADERCSVVAQGGASLRDLSYVSRVRALAAAAVTAKQPTQSHYTNTALNVGLQVLKWLQAL